MPRVAQLDAEFKKYLEIRLAPYAGTFKLPTRGFDDPTKLEIAVSSASVMAVIRAVSLMSIRSSESRLRSCPT